MDELNYCWGSRVGHELPAGFSGQAPPSLGTELTLQGVSNSWDQFGTHPWEENVLWNNFFFLFYLIQRIKSWRKRNAKEQHSTVAVSSLGCWFQGKGMCDMGLIPRCQHFFSWWIKAQAVFRKFIMPESVFPEVLYKHFIFSLFPVPCSYQRCAWGARAVLIEIRLCCS